MTQEQMAGYLGVTAPAVHKWEKGTSYPDITLLPALARLLDTDLNTLLSFKEELSDQEIAMFLNHLSEVSDEDGVEGKGKGISILLSADSEYRAVSGRGGIDGCQGKGSGTIPGGV